MGALEGIIGKISQLYTGLTTARMGYLDKLNLTGKATDDSKWTDARATKIDNLDATVSSRAASSTALSTATWTTGLATQLNLYREQPQISTAAGSIASCMQQAAGGYLNTPIQGPNFSVDKQQGYRIAFIYTNQTTLTTLLSVTGAGWVLGAYQANPTNGTTTSQFKITIDGAVVYDSTLTSLSTGYGRLPIGIWSGVAPYSAAINPFTPVRFDTSLLVQHIDTGSNIALYNSVVYLLD